METSLMRVIILGLCAIFVVGVFVAMFVSIWSTRRGSEACLHSRQSLGVELVWAAIPCLMLLSAAIPAAALILTSPSASPREGAALSAQSAEPANARRPVSARAEP
jgi:heme/copper-type cytochrome/quinol oxidase subunit 2